MFVEEWWYDFELAIQSYTVGKAVLSCRRPLGKMIGVP